jgi:hypothetical protein
MLHKQLTIVSVFGHNDGSAAIPSIIKSMKELLGSRGLLLSIKKPENLPSEIEWKRIFFLNYKQYTLFMMHSLYAFIETDYCLVVQDDSWVLNGDKFTEEFYQYDYIGPPTHCGFQFNDDASSIQHLFLQFHWLNKPNTFVVQNGGFSLRSKRFLEACNVHGITHTIPEPLKLKNDSMKKEKLWIHNWNEDVQLSSLFRPVLTSCGYKFAPLEVATRFAIEYLDPTWHKDIDFDQLVGHHAKSRILLPNNTVKVPNNVNKVGKMERDFISWMKNKRGYTIIMDKDWESKFGGGDASDKNVVR